MTSATDRGKGHNSSSSNGNNSTTTGSSHHHHSNGNGNGHNNNNNNHHSAHSTGHHHHRHHKDHHHSGSSASAAPSSPATSTATTAASSTTLMSAPWNTKTGVPAPPSASHHHRPQCSRHGKRSSHSRSKAESVLSTDSDIRFTRRKLGDGQRCGCAVIAGFLLTLLLASLAVYAGYTFLRPEPLPERVFRAKLRVTGGDAWTPELADQNSMRFQHKQRDYRERINLVVRRSELRDAYEGSEVLALDGSDGQPDLTVHVNLHFDPYRSLVSAADLTALFLAEINAPAARRRHFADLTVDPHSVHIAEVRGDQSDALHSAFAVRPRSADAPATPPFGQRTSPTAVPVAPPVQPPRVCQPLRLPYCASIGYNRTVYPNLLGHSDIAAVNADLIAFRELVDAECFRQAFDFVCRLLQPPCAEHAPLEAQAQPLCREYCQEFWAGCGARVPERFRRYFDCERYPEAVGAQSCRGRPGCAADLKTDALSSRLCDGVADCADLSDETTCAYCAKGSLYCGKGRACIAQEARCDGRVDCPDGSDERDCLSIAPQVSFLTNPAPITPHRSRFYADGFAVFLEKGETGKLCAEGLEAARDQATRRTVAESLCKALGYERLEFAEVRNDTEPHTHYVKVLDPRAEEISFVRTACPKRQALYVSCGQLECGVSSSNANSLPKMAAPGDWPWHVSLFRDDTHVCDGTLVSADWVLTTESCFQGQPKATWMAVFGAIRRLSRAPWTQRRRIIGMVKSPVEGSTAALVRLETSVAYSNFIRPICLSDHQQQNAHQHVTAAAAADSSSSSSISSSTSAAVHSVTSSTSAASTATTSDRPHTERLIKSTADGAGSHVEHNYFIVPQSALGASEYTATYADDQDQNPRASAAYQPQAAQPFRPSPAYGQRPRGHADVGLPLSSSTHQYETRQPAPPHIVQQYQQEQLLEQQRRAKSRGSSADPSTTTTTTTTTAAPPAVPLDQQQWTNCQTLGWSRQRDHLQRVQLQIGSMAACENVSIATVNSVCTEALFHQQDCSEEEFAGSPMMCVLPTATVAGQPPPPQQQQQQQQWALVGIASWRIVCAQMGIERPRMYDKIASNAAWIRDTISAV